MNEENIKVEDIIDALKSRWQLIVGITLVATILATVVSFFLIKPKYEASTKLFIGKESGESSSQNYNSNDVQMYQNLIKTYADIVTTNDLVNRAIENKGLNLKSQSVVEGLKVEPITSTQILKITYKSGSKQEARDVVAAITDEFVKTSNELIANANVKVVESVTLPESPVSPNKKLNIAIALVLGFMAGVGLALLLEFLDNTFKDKEQIENIVGVPVLGTIPNLESSK
ncbi:YveK family protein [Clostridium cibarium]|uniref:Capsular biosynthesis protein n=1 Tax=Clostridium cibarium TaxID=2762247 RepID=A0ABR8PUD2_9CLOT|nr:Wzz/FepE/Etk N-terminal domain-containing protein [Clostridium cibarium]MBD7911786.1 capsular biosynthesis protein [Clostridium cibarium]